MSLTAEEKIKKVRIKLLKTAPFFGYLSLYLQPKADNTIKTIGVNEDGELFYNESFVNELSEDELLFIEAHECCHLAFQHIQRCGNRDKMVWNYATDYAINHILDENNLFINSKKYLRNEDFDELFEEEIYDVLEKNKQNLKIEPDLVFPDLVFSSSSGQTKKMSESESIESIEKNWEKYFNESVWKDRLVEASQYAKSYGKKPFGLDRFFDQVLFPKVNWKQLLYKFISNAIVCDYSWLRPNRRFIEKNIYLPSTIKENLDVVLVVDTSASITEKMLSEFYDELIGIRDSFQNVKLTVITCDVDIHEIIRIENHEKPKIKMKGSGGTSFVKPFEWVDNNLRNTRVLVYLTDLQGEFPKFVPHYSVIWVHKKENEKIEIPFGERIIIE